MGTVAERSGKSFEQRLSESVARKLAEMEKTERDQWRLIHESTERGHAKSIEASPGRIPQRMGFEEDIAERVRIGSEAVDEQSREYWNRRKQMLDRIRNREPIF